MNSIIYGTFTEYSREEKEKRSRSMDLGIFRHTELARATRARSPREISIGAEPSDRHAPRPEPVRRNNLLLTITIKSNSLQTISTFRMVLYAG